MNLYVIIINFTYYIVIMLTHRYHKLPTPIEDMFDEYLKIVKWKIPEFLYEQYVRAKEIWTIFVIWEYWRSWDKENKYPIYRLCLSERHEKLSKYNSDIINEKSRKWWCRKNTLENLQNKLKTYLIYCENTPLKQSEL